MASAWYVLSVSGSHMFSASSRRPSAVRIRASLLPWYLMSFIASRFDSSVSLTTRSICAGRIYWHHPSSRSASISRTQKTIRTLIPVNAESALTPCRCKVTFGAFLASNLLAPRRRQFFRRCGQAQERGKACRQEAFRGVCTQQILLSEEAQHLDPFWWKTCWVFPPQYSPVTL